MIRLGYRVECLFAKFIGLVQHIKSDGFGGQNTFLQARNAGRNELVASVHTLRAHRADISIP